MHILCIGDVVGMAGCEFLRRHLPSYRRLNAIDLVVANGENSAEGNGITPVSAEHLFASGVDVITSGNHIYKRKEIFNLLEDNSRILRPMNFPDSDPGRGYTVVDTAKAQVCVINLLGTVYMDNPSSAFAAADSLLAKLPRNMIKIVDFHAEATSEKRSLAFYLDSRISALFGTHTHVQTADETILPGGTGYITDLGMTGPVLSVLGVDPKLAVSRFLTKTPVRFANATGECCLSGIILDISNKTFQTEFINRVQIC